VKNISAWAIRHPVTPLVLFMVLTFVGIVSFIRLPINLQPDVSFPAVEITVSQPGAAPVEIEKQIIQKIEGSIAGVGNVHNITSRATEGTALLFVEFDIGTPVDRAVNDTRDAVSRVRAELPQSIQEPQIHRINIDGGAIVYYAANSDAMSTEQLSWFVDNAVTKRLLAVPGVAQVQRSGGVDREIRVNLDPARLQALGLTAVQVNEQLRSLNQDAPGGRAQIAGGEQSIRVLGGAKTAEALAGTQVGFSGGRVVRLSDVAEVKDGVAEIRSIARLNGKVATTFNVYKAKGSSDVTVLEKVRAELDKLHTENPQVQTIEVFTTVNNTVASYKSSLHAFIEGSILAVVVVFFFLREWRSTAISALAIPLSAIPTFAFMQFMDFTLNGISLLALSLVAGVLVDDAIVEIENITRHMRMGKSGFQAALDAADEIGLAVVATSATIIAVFVPVSFMGGLSGQFFKQFGLTVAAAVFFSLLVARLITPVLAAYALQGEDHPVQRPDGPIMTWYLGALRWTAAHPWITVACWLVVFLLGIALLVFRPGEFVPPDDYAASTLNIELPPGVRIEETARIAGQATALIRKHPEVTNVVENIGSDDDGNVRTANLYISLVPHSQRKLSQKDWERAVEPELHAIADAQLNFSSGGGGDRDLTLYLTGEDPVLADQAARKIVAQMRELKELRGARIRGDLPRPEILIKPRFDLAASLGVTVDAISQTIRIATLGDLPQNAPKFSLSDRQIPIRVSLVESARENMSTLENMPVPTAAGGSVPLKAVADISFGEGPTAVRRYNQSRRLMIEADLNGVPFGDALKAVHNLPALKDMPQGVRLIDKGDAEFMAELLYSFLLAVGAGVLIVFAVLVLLFARLFQPIAILTALPPSLFGVGCALFITDIPTSLPVAIGLLMLMGIVAKNSILLVDMAIEEMRAGRDRLSALLEAGHKRARPIVMTSVAMVAGMLPVALGIGEDTAFRKPMAVAVIGGVITSTALTLLVVPAWFTLMDRLEGFAGPRFARILSRHSADAPASTGTVTQTGGG
jgi:multidrug efflux pump subunit AcrB